MLVCVCVCVWLRAVAGGGGGRVKPLESASWLEMCFETITESASFPQLPFIFATLFLDSVKFFFFFFLLEYSSGHSAHWHSSLIEKNVHFAEVPLGRSGCGVEAAALQMPADINYVKVVQRLKKKKKVNSSDTKSENDNAL